MRPRGYLVLFGASSGPAPSIDPIVLLQKGSIFLTRPSLGHYAASREELELRSREVFEQIAAGKLKLRIAHVYKLSDAAQAHRDFEGRKTTGKLLLVP
jgi:NADPH2:quinone reductase